MINYERVAEKIFAIIKGHGHTLSMYKEDGMDTTDAAEARRFFVAKPNYMITLEEDTSTIKINKNSDLGLEDLEGILKQMKNLARENMLNTQVKVFGKEITPKDFAYQAKKFKDSVTEATGRKIYAYDKTPGDRMGPADYDLLNIFDKEDEDKAHVFINKYNSKKGGSYSKGVLRKSRAPLENEYVPDELMHLIDPNWKENNMNELSEASLSRMSGSKKTSYQTLESVKMVVRHRKAVDEDVRGSRSRQIKAIFLEQGGERFRFPHNHLAGARAMARHMYEGGKMQDTVGEYIVESVSNLIQLAEFVRYTRTNKLINETSEDVVKIVKENIAALRGELKGLTGAKSYARISETIAARETNVLEEDETDLQDMFTVRKFDEKFGATLPLVSRLLSEKQAWRAALLEASKQTIFMKEKEDLAEEDIMEFENPVQQVGYKIGKVAKRMVESDDLSKFVAKVADKLIEGAKLSEFEQTIVRNVMENAKVEEKEDCVEEEKEDTVESISDAYELKMKMIEHEELFEKEDDDEDQGWCADCETAPCECSDEDKEWMREAESKKTACSKCNGTGKAPGESDGQYDRKIFSAVSCKACGGYGYGLSGDPARGLGKVEEADRTLANPYTPPPKRDCSDCGDFASYLTDRHENDLHYTCDTCGHEEDDRMVDLNLAGEIEEDYRDEPNRPGWKDDEGNWHSYEEETCQTCQGWEEVSGQDGGPNVNCPDCTWMDPAGGIHSNDEEDPAKMYEEKDAECDRCFGLGRAPAGGRDCDECGGTGKCPVKENTCQRCNGKGYDDEDEMGLCSYCDGSGKKAPRKNYS